MSNSTLIDGKRLSKHHSGKRKNKITKIAIHHAAGVIGGYNLAGVFLSKTRKVSSNYCLGSDGRLYLSVDEDNRAWTTSSAWCDHRAITIEVGNSSTGPAWTVSDHVLDKLVDLVFDICKRNDIYPCTYTGDKSGTLQKHEWYANTNCPGPYLGSKFEYIAEEVTRRLTEDREKKAEEPIGVYRVTANALNVRSGPGVKNDVKGVIRDRGAYTIMEEKNGWGRLKSGLGWISLKYTEPIKPKEEKKDEKIKAGDFVRIKKGAKNYTGKNVSSFVYNGEYIVDELKGDRAVLDKKGIYTAFNVKDLIK